MSLSCEAYCSETNLRTVNARISWVGSRGATEAEALSAADIMAPRLETTVFKNGFDQQMFASFPTGTFCFCQGGSFTPLDGAGACT